MKHLERLKELRDDAAITAEAFRGLEKDCWSGWENGEGALAASEAQSMAAEARFWEDITTMYSDTIAKFDDHSDVT
jgi:hypothetical protein